MMDLRGQLGWIQENRARPKRDVRAGDLIGRLVTDWPERDTKRIHQAVDRIHGVVDDEFLRVCTVVGLEGRCIIIEVAEASLLTWMGRQWRSRILAAFQGEAGCREIKEIQFRYGASRPAGTGEQRE